MGLGFRGLVPTMYTLTFFHAPFTSLYLTSRRSLFTIIRFAHEIASLSSLFTIHYFYPERSRRALFTSHFSHSPTLPLSHSPIHRYFAQQEIPSKKPPAGCIHQYRHQYQALRRRNKAREQVLTPWFSDLPHPGSRHRRLPLPY